VIDPTTSVVFDVNVYLDYILGGDGSWPLLPDVPPTTDNSAADTVSLAFASRFRLFASPHILRNIARVMRAAGQTETTVEGFVTAIVEICEFSGGAVIEPVDALILVTSDHHLLDLGPNWNGRLVMRPGDFVRRVIAR
jgi:hypothetical protein